MSWPLVVLAVLVACLNVGASVALTRNTALSTSQFRAQLAVIWLLPILGAIICLLVGSMQSREQAASVHGGVFVDTIDQAGTDMHLPPGAGPCDWASHDAGHGDSGD
jgi:hypothetical protein